MISAGCRPRILPVSLALMVARPWAMVVPSSVQILMTSPSSNSPSLAVMPAASRLFPKSCNAVAAPASMVSVPCVWS